MNIPQLLQKCKSREVYTSGLIILVGLSSFGLGRLSILEDRREPIRIVGAIDFADSKEETGSVASAIKTSPPASINSASVAGSVAGSVVASKSGTKYYVPWCGSASNISEKNKVWFATVEDARKAGYTPASNCKGLK